MPRVKKRVKIDSNPNSANCGQVSEKSIDSKVERLKRGEGLEQFASTAMVDSDKHYLRQADGRTKRTRAMKAAYHQILADLGGADQTSLAEMELARRCSTLSVIANEMENALAAGQLEHFDFEQYIILARTQASIFRILGVKRKQKKVEEEPTLESYLENNQS